MKIKIVCFGKLDEKFLIEAKKEYEKRLSRFCDLEIIEIKESNLNDSIKNQKINTQNLTNKLNAFKDYEIYLLDVEGKLINSWEFATLIDQVKNQLKAKLCFVIGPSEGYDSTFKKDYHRLSFGTITMPHQLFRIVLLEQIYRGFMINNHQKYHK